MSMPQPLVVAVISGKVSFKDDAQNWGGEKASAVASILLGKTQENDITPFFLPVAFSKCRMSFVQFAMVQGFGVARRSAYPRLLNPQEINIWLALDADGMEEAEKRIAQQGTSKNTYDREVFPNPVLDCGFPVPEPASELEYEEWFNTLTNKFVFWKKRLWNAFYESS